MNCCGEHKHSQEHSSNEERKQNSSRSFRFSNLIIFAFLGILLFFLFTEHRAHLFGFLPYLLILACPLMHLFHGRRRRNKH